MKAAVYYLSLPFIYLISALPFWCLYLLSDLLFLVVYKLLGYRKQVVYTNLKNSFPEKSEAEIKRIQERFYQFFFDLVVETLKTLSISPKTLEKRVSMVDTSILQKYHEAGQSVIFAMGHLGNWELGGARFALEPYHQLLVVYHPLQNKYFDQLIYKMRTRLGNGLYTMKNTLRGMVGDRGKLTATAFIADQTPSPKSAYWMDFLNQDTPVFQGTGRIANKFKYPVVYVSIKQFKRGYYDVYLEDLCPKPEKTDPLEIVSLFTQRLERDIKEAPEFWLWTHRRWKHKRAPKNTED